MWNPKQLAARYQNDVVVDEDDDSWEIRAFELDAGNINGTTWPPRSYTCTFCRREFRSAQALGGHMNVHRRDRARLHQAHPGGANTPAASSSSNFASSGTLLIPAQEFVANNNNGGLCLFYSLANPNCLLTPTTLNSCMDSPSKVLPVSATRPATPPTYSNHSATLHSLNSSVCQYSSNNQPSASNNNSDNNQNESKKDSAIEELDLELRLGRR